MKKKTDRFKKCLGLLWIAAVLTGCGAGELLNEAPRDFGLRQEKEVPPDFEKNDTKIVYLEDILAVPQEREACFLMEEAFSYAYDSLSAAEQIWYRDMERLLGSFADQRELNPEALAQFDFSEVDEITDKIFRCVLNDHPELFYVEGYSCTKYMRGDRILSVEFAGNYTMDPETALERKAAIEEEAEALLKGISGEASDYEKVKYVYDAIIRGTDYDLEAADSQNIYSVFVNHSSVCQGYAKATQYLLNRLGVECTLVQGTVDTGEGHAWNLVKVDGEYYYVDTTWGDVSYRVEGGPEKEENPGEKGFEEEKSVEKGSGEESPEAEAGIRNTEDGENPEAGNMPEINYDYLNVTTEELFRTHSVGGTVPMPVCTATEANYYIREGAWFTSCDREQMAELFRRAREQNRESISIKCGNEECYYEILEMLIDEHEIFEYLEKQEGWVAYARNEKQLSLTFWVTNE